MLRANDYNGSAAAMNRADHPASRTKHERGGWLRALLLLTVLTVPLGAWSRDVNYVPASRMALEMILAPPPAVGSTAHLDDLQAVLESQRSRSASEAQAARDDAQLSAFRVGDMLGPQFTAEKLPFTAQFLRRALSDSGASIAAAKSHFDRPRPFLTSAEVQPAIERPGGASYPSGHATFAYLSGILLAAMVPERASELFERAHRYAYNRVVVGVHYPTDIDAGRVSASVIAHALLQEPSFKADLARARSEVRAVLGLVGE